MKTAGKYILPSVFGLLVFLGIFQTLVLTKPNGLKEGEMINTGIHHKAQDVFLLADERYHYLEILRLSGGDINFFDSRVTSFPGYHFLVSLAGRIMPFSSPLFLRITAVFANFSYLLVSYIFIIKVLKRDKVKILQIWFFPLFFPFLFLFYNDIFSLGFFLLTLFFIRKGSCVTASLTAVFSLFFRQTLVVWFPLMIYSVLSGKNKEEKIQRPFSANRLAGVFILTGGLILTAWFSYKNGGLSLVDKEANRLVFFNMTNLYFLLFTLFIFYLPLVLYKIPEAIKLLANKKWLLILTIPLYLVFMSTFEISHPYNFIRGFIRNELLFFFTQSVFFKSAFFVLCLYGLLFLMTVRLEKKEHYLIYVIGGLSVLVTGLIEPRYYFLQIMLFELFRRRENIKAERALLSYFIILSLLLYKITLEGRWFL